MSRVNTFIRWWVHQLRTYDCDPSIFMMKYIIDRMELNREQQFWFCWIYANTYHVPTAWVVFNEFPDYENVPQARIERFSKENASRLPYQKDQKWLRGCLGETFASYKANITQNGCANQQAFWDSFFQGWTPTPQEAFKLIWGHLLEHFYKFGRYSTWFYLQTLKEICGLKIEPTDLMLNYDSSKMHRTGLCLALGWDEKVALGCKLCQPDTVLLNAEAEIILKTTRSLFTPLELSQLPVQPDLFSMETSLCSFRKLFRTDRGRYLGFYLDRSAEDITKTAECGWPGINWNLLWAARDEIILPQLNHYKVDKDKFSLFLDTGNFSDNRQLEDELDDWLNTRLCEQTGDTP